MDRGEWAGVQDVLPVPSMDYKGGVCLGGKVGYHMGKSCGLGHR